MPVVGGESGVNVDRPRKRLRVPMATLSKPRIGSDSAKAYPG